MTKVLIVGGGPAGMTAAMAAAERGCRVTLLEKNPVLGKKLLITGKGRCNVTNHCGVQEMIANIPRNGKFLYSAFSRFAAEDTMALFEKLGVPLKVERGNRVFPVSDRAEDIRDALSRRLGALHVEIRQGAARSLLTESGAVAGVALADGGSIRADRVVIACGGVSYPGTGSTGDGYRLARDAGHTVTEPKPSLVPLVCEEEW